MIYNNANQQGYLDFIQGRRAKAWIKKNGTINKGSLVYSDAFQYILGWGRAKELIESGKAA